MRWFLRVGALALTGSLAAAAAVAGEEAGLPVFPGATARPEVARAVEAYYRAGVGSDRDLSAVVYETSAPFDRVYAFYGPKMDEGKWGWRRRRQPLEAHAAALRFMRARLLASSGAQGRLPSVFRPLFGDPALDEAEFAARLERLVRRFSGVQVEIGEGTRTMREGPARGQVRLTIERPYVDLERMRLVDRTRLVVVRVSDRPPAGAVAR
ncbi:MAG TPA: hypothetical protein VNI83_00170 [Vicinamibacterales bacterium]|nr:hypothetical protein [Vicinamibacterales bacterium]